ncbi:EscN/YscN/HrcN family type III secretion system ATPase, partial [Pseudomonas syringae pv. actinidiae]|nr:EscN/YscN/HrcN family type III secretion system ATPase [Pseudomonas syringae pv. actinidiae]
MNAALNQWKDTHAARLSQYSAVRVSGRVSAVRGILLECKIPAAKVGDLCEVSKADGSFLLAEIVGFTQECTLLSALGAPDGIQVGAPIRPLGIAHRIGVDDTLLGCVLDGFGRPLLGDCLGAFAGPDDRRDTLPVIADALPPTQRPRITRSLPTGIRAIDSAILLGEGQRVGLFAGAGCGKTTLMAELARNMDCDVIVFGLIGER